MRKPWWHRWRWLLTLLIGAGTWWCVGCLTTARPWFEAYFPLVKSSVEPGSLGFEDVITPIVTTAKLWDSDGHFLLVETPGRGGKHQYQMIDLKTRQQVAANELNYTNPIKGDEFKRITAKGSWHKANKSGTKHVVILRDASDPPDIVTALWEWNPFTNEVSCSREFPKAERLDISLNGAVLLEVERITPIQSLLLLPPSLPTALSILADANLQLSGLVQYRLWSLPELKLHSSYTTQQLEFANHTAFLTPDGTHLVFTIAVLPKGYTSVRSFKVKEGHSDQERHFCYHQTAQNRIFSTSTGQLVWSLKDDHLNWFQADPNVHPGTEAVGYSSKGQPYSLHLPTKSWIPSSVCKNSKRLDGQHHHGICYFTTESRYPHLLTFDLEGRRHHATTLLDCNYAEVIPSAPQALLLNQVNRQDQLPGWLPDLLWDRKWFQSWAQEQWLNMSVIDYSTSRIIWSRRRYETEHYELTNRWLMFEDQDSEANTLNVSVYALPFPSWSPWWARGAGLLLGLVLWRRLRLKQVPRPATTNTHSAARTPATP